MKLRVLHSTHYDYSEKVKFTPHKVILRPREDHHTKVHSFSLRTMPSGRITWLRDTQENCIAQCYIEGESRQLAIQAEMTVELLQDNPFDFIFEDHAAAYPFQYSSHDMQSLGYYLPPFRTLHMSQSGLMAPSGYARGNPLAADQFVPACLSVKQLHKKRGNGHPDTGSDPAARVRKLPRFCPAVHGSLPRN